MEAWPVDLQEPAKLGFHYSSNNQISLLHCGSLRRDQIRSEALGPVTSVDVEVVSNCLDFLKGRLVAVTMVV